MDELWRRLEELFHDCAGIPPALRSDYLDVRCAGEPRIRSEVESLLAASTDAEGFIEEIIRRVVDEQVPGPRTWSLRTFDEKAGDVEGQRGGPAGL